MCFYNAFFFTILHRFLLIFINLFLKQKKKHKKYYQTHDHEIPRRINCDKLVSVMAKELSKAEVSALKIGFYRANKRLNR